MLYMQSKIIQVGFINCIYCEIIKLTFNLILYLISVPVLRTPKNTKQTLFSASNWRCHVAVKSVMHVYC